MMFGATPIKRNAATKDVLARRMLSTFAMNKVYYKRFTAMASSGYEYSLQLKSGGGSDVTELVSQALWLHYDETNNRLLTNYEPLEVISKLESALCHSIQAFERS